MQWYTWIITCKLTLDTQPVYVIPILILVAIRNVFHHGIFI